MSDPEPRAERRAVRARVARVEVPRPAPVAALAAAPAGPSAREVAPPRLARYELVLPSGREVGVNLCGQGVPLVVIHGFGGEGILYAQSLARLVRSGFKVITIDAPGHGRSGAVPLWSGFDRYTSLVAETLDHLGVRRAVLVGHSMGGRVVSELAAEEPHRVLAVCLIDAIVGEVWDRMVGLFRAVPPLYAAFGVGLLADTASTLPLWGDPAQAWKLARLLTPTSAGHVLRPWRMAGPVLTILRAPSSDAVLGRLHDHGVATFVIHGDSDVLVPLRNARAAAERTHGHLVTVHGARHSWLLSDPETLPALLAELQRGPLGDALRTALAPLGVAVGEDGSFAVGEAEAACCRADAPVHALTPDATPVPLRRRHRPPRYRWSIEPPTPG
ncbi:MAG: alpha/beta hydrolase [Acidimicrobiales bacterium]